MCAEIYTKAFTDQATWTAACDLINIVDPKRLVKFMGDYAKEQLPPVLSSPFAPDPVLPNDRYSDNSEATTHPHIPLQRGGDPLNKSEINI